MPGRGTQSRLVRGYLRVEQIVTTRPRPSPGRRRSYDSLEAILQRDRQSRLVQVHPGGRDTHDSSEAILGQETQLRLAPSPTLSGRRGHDSPETNPGQATHFQLAQGHLGRCSDNNKNNLCDINNVCHIYFTYYSNIYRFVSLFHIIFYPVTTHGHIASHVLHIWKRV
jgi:hypothetical protein